MTTTMDAEREFWIGLRNTYIQQIRLLRARFGVKGECDSRAGCDRPSEDGQLVESVVMALGGAVAAIERRWGLRGGLRR